MLAEVIGGIRVARPGPGRPRSRPEVVLADKGYPSRANRAYLAGRGIKANIPDRDDQLAGRKRRGRGGGRPPGFDADLYRRRNVVERSFNRLKNWRGIATRTDKTARNYRAGILLAATLIWIKTDLINTPSSWDLTSAMEVTQVRFGLARTCARGWQRRGRAGWSR